MEFIIAIVHLSIPIVCKKRLTRDDRRRWQRVQVLSSILKNPQEECRVCFCFGIFIFPPLPSGALEIMSTRPAQSKRQDQGTICFAEWSLLNITWHRSNKSRSKYSGITTPPESPSKKLHVCPTPVFRLCSTTSAFFFFFFKTKGARRACFVIKWLTRRECDAAVLLVFSPCSGISVNIDNLHSEK